MPEGHNSIDESAKLRPIWPERTRTRLLFGLVIMVLGFIGFAWITREEIARDIISDELARLEIPARYTIRSIGPSEQVLSDVVLGNPDKPDFTAESVIVRLSYGLGTPEIGRIILVNPRLYGSFRAGELSFGTLDKAIFAPSETPPALPDFVLELFDGRALIETDYGAIGVKAEGKGNLADGFAGTIAASVPQLDNGTCSTGKVSLFGRISSDTGLPAFNGPLRVRQLACPSYGAQMRSLDWQLDIEGESDFSGFDAEGALAASMLAGAGVSAGDAAGTIRLNWSEEGWRTRFELKGRNVTAPNVKAAEVSLAGGMRAQNDLTWLNSDIDAGATNVKLVGSAGQWVREQASNEALAPFVPLLERLDRGLQHAQRSNSLQASINVMQGANSISVSIPQALLKGNDGSTIASLSRVRFQFAEQSNVPRIDGNARISARDLPSMSVRMEQGGSNGSVMRVRMEPYAANGASIALPELSLSQSATGAVRFSGRALVTARTIQESRVQGLSVPIEGTWTPDQGLALVTRCSRIEAREIASSGIVLDNPRIELCPRGSGAALRMTGNRLFADLAVRPFALKGSYDGQPAKVSSGRMAFSTTKGLSASDLELNLGEGDGATRFALAKLSGNAAIRLAGTFDGVEVALGVVPLDMTQGAGTWSYRDGVLLLTNGSLAVADRKAEPRFEPLIARGAVLSLDGGIIAAEADLREPFSDRVVTRVLIRHELASGIGSADLVVQDLLFDEALQPAAGADVCLNRATGAPGSRPAKPGLSCLALGIVANVKGTVSGQGQIEWTPEVITSSGTFSTQDSALAAAFGPLERVSGTVEFTDLLALTTAPGQRFTIGAINPGVEVFDGIVDFNLREGQILEIEGGRWPFMGGELKLEPAVLDFRQPMDRRYVLLINGLDAARFVQYMELGNLSATGVFDGSVPIVFDTDGNGRIEQGLLRSRPPGGNVSYVGELTYEDLGAMANFAFQSLRSLDFTQMEVEMNGPLTGEIITRLKFDGVRQGQGASRNFVTSRLARLPIQFRINIRADFYSLLTNLQSMYDPAFVRDPRDLGLLESDGTRFLVPRPPAMPATKPEDIDNSDISDEPAIQPQESEPMP
ncbi:YdbH domain-containing protein [Altererythrobacter sp. GH1-8]|uniref:intermembrane phospholipid transport protein YdbH family protein n=1 Tax=Altererythrobacter sp. GH1-8 TaxID=3349333 RepID=UPI00374D3A97